MEKNVKMSLLCQIYGKLLTEKQYLLLDDYYNNDLSLSEIAENNEITRQAVRDILLKGEQKLTEYEEKLGFLEKSLKQEQKISEVLVLLSNLDEQVSDKKVKTALKKIRTDLKELV